MNAIKNHIEPSNTKVESWFEDLVAIIRADQLQIESNIASPQKAEFYNNLILGQMDKAMYMSRNMSTMHFIGKLLNDYVDIIKKSLPESNYKIAVDLSDAKVLVWAQIEDNNENQEDVILLTEARINAKYSDHGFYVSSTITELSDNLTIPNHYKVIIE
jgi:hypothetical protein